MVTSNVGATDVLGRERVVPPSDSTDSRAFLSGVSWGAIMAGAVAAAALSLILLMLGIGLGLSSVSPWSQQGIGASAFGLSTILWLTFTQLAASGMGGYLAGRLRTKWIAIHTDEVYFRDTAHGFLAWATASLATATLLTSVIGSIVNGAASLAASVATTATATAVGGAAAGSGMANSTADGGPMGYFVESLFSAPPSPASNSAATLSATSGNASGKTLETAVPETTRIFSTGIQKGALPDDDVRYVGQVVAQRTGVGQVEAEKRVRETFARLQANLREAEVAAKDAADKARKVSAYGALWLFISLLVGAFTASLGATFGGRHRDL